MNNECFDFDQLAAELISYSALSYNRNLVCAAGGNISARYDDGCLITGTNVSLRNVRKEDLVYVSHDGSFSGNMRPSKETGFHLCVYQERQDVNFVIHLHPTYATLWSIFGMELPMLTQSAKAKIKSAPVIVEATPGSVELIDNVRTAVRSVGPEVNSFLMEGHGILTTGRTIEECFNTAELLEETAKLAVLNRMINL